MIFLQVWAGDTQLMSWYWNQVRPNPSHYNKSNSGFLFFLEQVPGSVLVRWRHGALSHAGRASLSQWKTHECKLIPPFPLGQTNKTSEQTPRQRALPVSLLFLYQNH